jgi:hypothetical protein
MKVIVKNNSIIGIHTDNQDIKNAYPSDIIVRILPNTFQYNIAITDTNIDNDGNTFDYDRFSISNLDLDPLNNTTNINLINRQKIAADSISEEVNQFIQYKPANGDVRYTQAKQSSFTDILMYCKDWLEDNPSATTEQKEPYETRITLINSARTWIRTVLSYYYDKIAAIRTVTDETWSSTITWDFSTFDESDPDVWLETVKI